MVSAITPDNPIQPDLFMFNFDRQKKDRAVGKTIDRINVSFGADTLMVATQLYNQTDKTDKSLTFTNSIRRDLKSPDYTTRLGAFRINI